MSLTKTAHSARTMRSPLLEEGPRRSGPGAEPWRTLSLVLAVAVLLLAWKVSRGATGTGSACDFDGECPPALVCSKGKCAPARSGS